MRDGVKWVGTWAAAPAPAEGFAGFNNHTIRLNPRVSIGGERLRVRISNAYGNRPVLIGTARVALRDKGPAVVPGSDRKLTFGGKGCWITHCAAGLGTDVPAHLAARADAARRAVGATAAAVRC
jgi:hypothetical protein